MNTLVVGLFASVIWGAEYGGDVSVRNRDELLALAAAGEVDDDDLDQLLALYDTPINPATATADELALLPGLGRAEARALVDARNAGTEPQFRPLARDQLSAFAGANAFTLRLNLGGIYRNVDPFEGYARARVIPWDDASFGALVVTRDRTRAWSAAGRLLSNGDRREVGLERWHAASTFGPLELVVGNYACSFGEGLTFSIARRPYAPTLFVNDDLVRSRDGSTVRPAQALRGVAARLRIGLVELEAFVSYRDLDLYQYGEWLHDGESPTIVDPHGVELHYATVADAMRERLGGVAVSVRDGEQAIGVIGYVASARVFDPNGVFSPSSRYPAAPYFGAIGAYGIAQVGPLRLHGEIAGTLNGGLGGIARVDIAASDSIDVSVSGRYYGLRFDNPYTRSFSEPDLYEGARARDERGVMIESAMAFGEVLRIAGSFDVWTAAADAQLINARARGRALLAFTAHEMLTVEGQHVDKDLLSSTDAAYLGTSCSSATAELDDCARGARSTVTARLVDTRIPGLRIAAGVRRTLEDADNGAVVGETRLLAHVSWHPWVWLTAAAVVSQRLSQRVTLLGDPDRVATFIASADNGTVRVELFARSEERWVNNAERNAVTAAFDFGVQL